MKFYCFPVHTSGDKKGKPVYKGWQQSAELREPRVGDGIFTGHPDAPLVVVDVDVKNGKNGWNSVLALELEGHDLPDTLRQTTKSGGTHFVYRSPIALDQGPANVLGPGLDIRSDGGYIVFYEPFKGEIADVPQWLIDRRGQRQPRQKANGAKVEGINAARAAERAINYLRSAEPAIEGQGGDDHTYRVACRVKDLGVTREQAFDLMLVWNETNLPPWEPDVLQAKVDHAYRYGVEPVGIAAPEATFAPAVASPFEDEPEPHPLDKLNREFAYVEIAGGDAILHERQSYTRRRETVFMPMEVFHRKLAASTIQIDGKEKPLTKEWLKWSGRRSYEGLVFDPETKDTGRFYNLWRGLAFEPLDRAAARDPRHQRAIESWLYHAEHNVCGGDRELLRWLIGWFAHLVQHPGVKPLTALVFKGPKGVGKNALVERVGCLLGSHFTVTADRRYLLGNFNSHIENTLLIVFDEAFWSGDKESEGKLKNLITGAYHKIERKNHEPYDARNLTRVAIIGNEDWVIPASADERRFAVFKVGTGWQVQNHKFEEMRLAMEAGGYRLLLRYLLDYDLTGIDLSRAPNTQALVEQKHLSLEVFDKWWFDSLRDGVVLGSTFNSEWPTTITAEEFRNSFRRVVGPARYHDATDQKVANRMAALMGIKTSNGRVGGGQKRVYKLPPLDECRAIWTRKFGKLEDSWE